MNKIIISKMNFAKFVLGAMAVTFVAMIILAMADTLEISPKTATVARIFFAVVVYVISYLLLLKLMVIKRITNFVNANPWT